MMICRALSTLCSRNIRGCFGQDGCGVLVLEQFGVVEDYVLHGPCVLRAVPRILRDHLDVVSCRLDTWVFNGAILRPVARAAKVVA